MTEEDRFTIRIPTADLMGCHNCKWKNDAKVCSERDHNTGDCWENDGTYEPW